VEREATPASFPVTVLLQELDPTGEALFAPGQATGRKMAPDRRRAGATSEEAALIP
jgi:hypothetical protein